MKIEYIITTETLGESSDADHQEYAHALLAALQTEYPDADIDVRVVDNISSPQISVVYDDFYAADATENVERIAGLVWNGLD